MPDNSPGATAARVEGRDLVIDRTFDAPRPLVFNVWTQPEHLLKWFGPHGWSLEIVEADVRPGGVLHYCMRSEGGQESWGRTVYEEIVEPERIVYLDTFSDAQGGRVPNLPVLHVTVTFVESDGKTHVNLLTRFESVAELEAGVSMGMVKGWSETLDRLADYLTSV